MALLIYDNGNLVKNPSDATFPLRGVNATYSSRAPQSSTQRQPLPAETKATSPSHESSTSSRSTVVSSRLYEETGRKSDSLQDRRRLTALHVMSSPVVTIGVFDTVQSAWELMQKTEIDHLVVVNGQGHPVGIITGGDLLRFGQNSTSFVENLLNNSLIAVSPETLVREIALIFMEHKVSSVPVVNANHQVVGIVCRSDLLRLLVSGPNLEQRA